MRQHETQRQRNRQSYFRLVFPAIYLSANVVTSFVTGRYSENTTWESVLQTSFLPTVSRQTSMIQILVSEKDTPFLSPLFFLSIYPVFKGQVGHIECLYLWLRWFKMSTCKSKSCHPCLKKMWVNSKDILSRDMIFRVISVTYHYAKLFRVGLIYKRF